MITTAVTCPDDDRDGAATKLSLAYWYDAAAWNATLTDAGELTAIRVNPYKKSPQFID